MSSLISEAIKKVFSSDFDEMKPAEKRSWFRFFSGFSKMRGLLFLLIIFLLVYVYYMIYYFNKFVTLETSLCTAKAQIQVRMQLRKNVMINLVKTVQDYAKYEHELFQFVVEERSNMMTHPDTKAEPPPPGDPNLSQEELVNNFPPQLLEQIKAIAENYPDLQSSNHYQKLIDAVVDVEKLLGEQKRAYNEAVNNYMQSTTIFPNNIFAFLFRFKAYPYIQVDNDVQSYNEIQYPKLNFEK